MKKFKLNKKNTSIKNYIETNRHNEFSSQLITYNESQFEENKNYHLENFKGFQQNNSFYWLNIHGINEVEKIETLCTKLNIHVLTVQDILDVNQRPKIQEFDNYLFFTLKSIIPSDSTLLKQEQLSFILGKNYLISFQEYQADFFHHIREQIRKNIGIVRKRATDYLLFVLLESILNNYFITLDSIENKTNELEVIEIDNDPSPEIINSNELFKRQVYHIKKTIIPIKDFTTKIVKENLNFIDPKHLKYFDELKDLCLSLIDTCEQLTIRLESSTNLFFSVQGHRMNQVMKTLTVISSIFIPLTFIAGIYGMNFYNMPELNWKWGYLSIWIIIFVIFIGMILFFKKKKWF